MKNSEVDWSVVEVKEKCKKCEYEIHGEKYDLEYEVLKYDKYYKVVVSLPFSCESNWRSTKYTWDKRVIEIIESALKKRYKEIKIRQDRAKKLNGFFEKSISREKLFHAPLHENIVGNKYVGDYVKEYEEYRVKSIELEACEKEKNVLEEVTFQKLLLNGKCDYCGITIKEINQLSEEGKLYTKRARGYSMEIDQKEPNGLYSDDNCVASCYWCNNAKTDEFKPHEFKEIARGINAIWNQRLGHKEEVPFNDNAEIWKKL